MKLITGTLDDDILRWQKVFISNLEGLNFSKNTISTYRQQINTFYDYCVEIADSVTLKNIKQMHLSGFFAWLENTLKPKNATKAGYARTLRSFFKFISKNNDDLVDFDYLFDGFKLKLKKGEKKKVNFMDSSERERILAFLEDKIIKKGNFSSYRNSLLTKLLLLAGLRVSEALELKLSDFSLGKDGFYEIEIIAKGGEAQTAYIEEYAIKEEINYIRKFINFDDDIFVSSRNIKLKRQNVNSMLNNVYKKCHINKTGCHILRHSLAMNMLEKNTSLGVIQKVLRHKRIETTMVYADATPEMVKEALKINN